MLNNLHYSFKRGTLYVLVGPSGSGKSTLLHIIAGVVPVSTGEVLFRKRRRYKKHVSLILQEPHFYGDLSLLANIKIVRLFNKTKGKKTLLELAKLFNIHKILRRKSSVCSGGEKARANLVRGIYQNKQLILVDEPTAHLDHANSVIVAHALSEVAKSKLCIVTTHEPELFSYQNVVKLYLENGALHVSL